MNVNIDLTKEEVETLLGSLEFEIGQNLDIIYDEKHDIAGEYFVVTLENLNRLAALYVRLNSLINSEEGGEQQ